MDDKKLNWRDLLSQHMQGTIQNTVAIDDCELRVLVIPEYNAAAELEQLRDFMLEFTNGSVQATSVAQQGFSLPGNSTVH